MGNLIYCVDVTPNTMYVDPLFKQSANPADTDYISKWSVFQMLDKLLPTATGMDELPAWFLTFYAWVLLYFVDLLHTYYSVFIHPVTT